MTARDSNPASNPDALQSLEECLANVREALTGLNYGNVTLTGIERIHLHSGYGNDQLTGGALARLEQLTPEGFEARIDLSITDDWPLAQAFVIISAVVPGKP